MLEDYTNGKKKSKNVVSCGQNYWLRRTNGIYKLREQAERHRLAETLDFEIRRWTAGNEENLHALLSTLHCAKALAEKNQRNLQTQREQAERHMSCLYL
ncbi:hypothetical protein AAHE18_04G064100 [Arachis hypogaea]